MRLSSGVFSSVKADPSLFRVRPQGAGWCVIADGQLRPLSLHPTRQDAINLATTLAKRGARVQIHEPDESVHDLDPWSRTG